MELKKIECIITTSISTIENMVTEEYYQIKNETGKSTIIK